MARKPPSDHDDHDEPPAALFGPAPRLHDREDEPELTDSQKRTARVSAVRVAVISGQYVIDRDAVARNLVDEELAPKVKS
jgi:hypothetical protein